MADRDRQTESWTIYTRSAARRRRIVSVARGLFIKHGFHGTGVAQIATASGIAVGQIYRDFAAKEDVVAVLVAEECASRLATEALSEATAARDPEAIWAWLRAVLDSQTAMPEGALFAEILAEAARNDKIASIVAGSQAKALQLVSTALASLVPGEAARDGRGKLAEIVLGHSLGLAHVACLRRTGPSAEVIDAIILSVRREVDRLLAL